MANRSVIAVGVILIWQKAVDATHTYDSYETILSLLKFGVQTKIAKLPN